MAHWLGRHRHHSAARARCCKTPLVDDGEEGVVLMVVLPWRSLATGTPVLMVQPRQWTTCRFGRTFRVFEDYSFKSILTFWVPDVLVKKLLCFEWSPPWHFKTACWHHFCLKLLSRDFCPTNYPNHLFHLAGHCAPLGLPRSLYHTRASLQVIYNILVWHSF